MQKNAAAQISVEQWFDRKRLSATEAVIAAVGNEYRVPLEAWAVRMGEPRWGKDSGAGDPRYDGLIAATTYQGVTIEVDAFNSPTITAPIEHRLTPASFQRALAAVAE